MPEDLAEFGPLSIRALEWHDRGSRTSRCELAPTEQYPSGRRYAASRRPFCSLDRRFEERRPRDVPWGIARTTGGQRYAQALTSGSLMSNFTSFSTSDRCDKAQYASAGYGGRVERDWSLAMPFLANRERARVRHRHGRSRETVAGQRSSRSAVDVLGSAAGSMPRWYGNRRSPDGGRGGANVVPLRSDARG